VAQPSQGPVPPRLVWPSLDHSCASSFDVGSHGKIITPEKS
jgi:hypothetical protein